MPLYYYERDVSLRVSSLSKCGFAPSEETAITLSAAATATAAATSDKVRVFNMHRRARHGKYNIARTLHKIVNESGDLQPLSQDKVVILF